LLLIKIDLYDLDILGLEDLISIFHVFSCRIDGMKKYKKKIRKDEEIAKSIQNRNKPNRRTEKED